MGTQAGVRLTFISLWLLLVTAVCLAIIYKDRFFIVEARSIAQIKDLKGVAFQRSEGLVTWASIANNAPLVDGDRIATGQLSEAKIQFGPERSLILGSESQIQITSILQANETYAYMINLLRGTLVADFESDCDSCLPLIIRSGRTTFQLEKGKKLGLFKKPGKEPEKFNTAGPWLATSTSKPKVTLSPDFVAPPVDEEPIIETKPVAPKPDDPAQFLPDIASQFKGREWWTSYSIKKLARAKIKVPVTLPIRQPIVGNVSYVLKISGPTRQKTVLVPLKKGSRTVQVTIADIAKVATLRRSVGAVAYEFTLETGSTIEHQGRNTVAFNPSSSRHRLVTFGELGSGAMTLALDRLKGDRSRLPWMKEKDILDLSKASLIIRADDSNVLKRFRPYMKGAEAIGLYQQGIKDGIGKFAVRDGVIIAQLSGRQLDSKTLTLVRRILKADYIFEGQRSALHSIERSRANDLTKWIAQRLNTGATLYIMKNKKLFPVSKEFIKKNPEVAQFIEDQAKAIFIEQVAILDHR